MQLSLFKIENYDINFNYFRELGKSSPLQWDLQRIKTLSKKWLKIICIKFQLPYSGTKKRLIEHLKNYIALAQLIQKNFVLNSNSSDYELIKKPKSKIKDIAQILKKLNIRHSWLKKREKLLLAKNKFIEMYRFKPEWRKFNF